MRALRIEPNNINIVDISDTLDDVKAEFQKDLEKITLSDGGVMLIDCKGIRKKKQHNDLASYISSRHIYGTALIVGLDGYDLTDVPERYFVWLGK